MRGPAALAPEQPATALAPEQPPAALAPEQPPAALTVDALNSFNAQNEQMEASASAHAPVGMKGVVRVDLEDSDVGSFAARTVLPATHISVGGSWLDGQGPHQERGQVGSAKVFCYSSLRFALAFPRKVD